jgi:hypothetical protein
MKKFRKAATAGGLAAAGVFGTAVTTSGLPTTRDGWLALGGAMVGAFLVTGVATYNIPYTPA